MQKKLSIIFGMLLGTTISLVMILGMQFSVANAAVNWWDEVVAADDAFEWKDVFSPSSKGENLYALVHAKLLRYPERDSVREIAKNNGLTRDEAVAVINGSLYPLMNTNAISSNLTQEAAKDIMVGIQEQYSYLKEAFELQNELDLYTAPSEIFSNGDLGDSGFDLVHDLSIIEEILFVNVVNNTVGKPFGGQLDSPYLPTEEFNKLPTYIAEEGPTAIGRFSSSLESAEEVSVPSQLADGALATGQTEILIGETPTYAEILKDDICPVADNELLKALATYQDQRLADSTEQGVTGPDGIAVIDTGKATSGPQFDGEVGVKQSKAGLPDEDLAPAPADEWRSPWCPGIAVGDDNVATGSSFGKTGFSSLGGVVNSLIGQSAGAFAATGNDNIALHIAVCFDIKTIEKTVSSYSPGSSCVLCELEKINELMSKTLSHSLVPNKATGNLLESAKCKDAYEPFLDMEFITIAAPIPTPSNDEVIYGKNIFEEWNKFVEEYQPVLLPPVEVNYAQKFTSSAGDINQERLLLSITDDLDTARAKALLEIEKLESAGDITNLSNYLQTIGVEIKAMTSFFESYNKIYTKSFNICKEIGNKPSLD